MDKATAFNWAKSEAIVLRASQSVWVKACPERWEVDTYKVGDCARMGWYALVYADGCIELMEGGKLP
jgi:hypothetical protein